LFWPLSGNTDLVPESGYTGDFSWKKSKNFLPQVSLECKFNLYQTSVRNFIQWLPSGNFWMPSNVGNVHIQGMNLAPEFRFRHSKAILRLGYDLGICQSEFAGNRFPGDDAKGKQLIYIPVIQSQMNLSVQLKRFDMKVSIEQTGKRNTDPSGQHALSAFSILNARIGTHFSFSDASQFNLFLEGRNLTNSTYQMVVGYAMPLRQFNFGMELQFK
jgi:iron complex outermembrane receptor protein